MIHVGIDDTDSLVGMCTTYLAIELVRDLEQAGFRLTGPPRLVRLNPMIALKTRGNAAVSMRVERRTAGTDWCGSWRGTDILYGPPRGKKATLHDLVEVERIVADLLDRRADIENGANPGYVVSPSPLPGSLYRRAVTRLVQMDEAIASLPPGSRHGGSNGALGIVGAAAAIAWPARRRTWELIAFRAEEKWGHHREVEPYAARRLGLRFPETFNNYDEQERRILVTPRSPCPVLFGIRAVRPQRLLSAARTLRTGERWDSCLLFSTNQATGDHLVRSRTREIEPGTCVETRGEVVGAPRSIRGGAVIFAIASGVGRIDCAAYEPTRGFRKIVSSLVPGDRIVVRGGVRDVPRSINLESLDILRLVRSEKRNPTCARCLLSMESAGRGQGFRCVSCGSKRKMKATVTLKRKIRPGRYEVPLCAMRHLHRPIGLQLA